MTRLALALAEADVAVGVWAPDRSAATTPLLPPNSRVERLTGTETQAMDKVAGVDVVHDNGIWLPHNHRLAQLARAKEIPRLVSTRGMLEPWAMNHKRARKRIAWALYQRRDLSDARCHHATAESEARNVERFALGVPVSVIPNGVDVPEVPRSALRAPDRRERTALFLGRIYPVKGLPMLIEAWARVLPANWRLQIAGPDEAGHRAEVEKAVAAARLGQLVSFEGPVGGEAKRSLLAGADLMVLPSHSESFGMAVAEALAHGVPVLTTTSAPWPMLTSRGCGWRVAPTVEGITDGLREATSTDVEALASMGAKGRDLALAEFQWGRVADQFVALYGELTARHGAPFQLAQFGR
ncbi:MAG: glycosyltransferase [Gemmatimonadaceae bacterium]|nr:glycosyltransferase [Gemmatimonadaceae bacterium]MDQ3242226.1 glycosyltransferase [Gemmatimonadota bacterium]